MFDSAPIFSVAPTDVNMKNHLSPLRPSRDKRGKKDRYIGPILRPTRVEIDLSFDMPTNFEVNGLWSAITPVSYDVYHPTSKTRLIFYANTTLYVYV